MALQDSIEVGLGVSFSDKSLLQLALTHSSYLNEDASVEAESNERLEFLGDAVLGCIVAHDLYVRAPHRPEGDLTSMRSDLVRGDTLAQIARSLRLGQFLFMGKGEEGGGGRDRDSNLAAAYEALVGAIFLDKGYDAARDYVLGTFTDELNSASSRPIVKNAKSRLQELVQKHGSDAPSYRIVDIKGQDHARQFTAEVLIAGQVMGKGVGSRKSTAEQEAAQQAVDVLERMSP